MGYDRHEGHAGIFGGAAKSSYDGKRKSPMSNNSARAYNPIQRGEVGSGRLPTPDLAGRIAIGGSSPGCQYPGNSRRRIVKRNDTRSERINWAPTWRSLVK